MAGLLVLNRTRDPWNKKLDWQPAMLFRVFHMTNIRPKACTVFARSKAGIVGSNSTQSMDVWYVYVFIVFV
jgi:hypothetical protein